MLQKKLTHMPEQNSSIYIRRIGLDQIEAPDHFHNDLELNLILKGSGVRFVGDSVQGFKENDLVLLGPNIPHFWKHDQFPTDQRNLSDSEAIVIRFQEQFMGKGNASFPEMKLFEEMLNKSGRGLLISGEGKGRIISSIKKLVDYQGIERLIIFLGILNAIFKTCKLTVLSSAGFMLGLSSKNQDRMNRVYDTVVKHFQEKITLEDLAKKADMNPSAFSRYFSQWTGRSVTGFLREVRLGYACKLLEENQLAISEVIKRSGFHNQANFNKRFIARMNMTPIAYRKMSSNL